MHPATATSSFAIDLPEGLLQRVRSGDRQAYEQLYRRFSRQVFTLGLRICGDHGEAEEVLQDTMLKVFRQVDSYRGGPGRPFWAWLRQIAVNEALMRLRRRPLAGMEAGVGEDVLDGLADATCPPPCEAADAAALARALDALPALTRSVFWLYHGEGYTHEEIAALMKRSTSFSKSQLARGTARLRRLLRVEDTIDA